MTVVQTESDQWVVHRPPIVHQTIRMHIKKFGSMVYKVERYGEPEVELWSEGASSQLVPRAVWKMCACLEAGDQYDCTGDEEVGPMDGPYTVFADFNLRLTGPMADAKETLWASYNIHLGGDSEDHSIHRGSYEFGSYSSGRDPSGYSSGICVTITERGNGSWWDLDPVSKALHRDGSLLVVAHIDFTPPDNSAAAEIVNEDCTFMVGGEVLKAHRFPLMQISPIFARMFGNQGFQEARDGIVRIEDSSDSQLGLKDLTAKPYKVLLSYSSTGCVDWAHCECKQDVLILACKYLIYGLKHRAERELARGITVEGVAELAQLAETYSCELLKKACIHFISSNYPAVVSTSQWEALKEAREDLASELLRLALKDETTAADRGWGK